MDIGQLVYFLTIRQLEPGAMKNENDRFEPHDDSSRRRTGQFSLTSLFVLGVICGLLVVSFTNALRNSGREAELRSLERKVRRLQRDINALEKENKELRALAEDKDSSTTSADQ